MIASDVAIQMRLHIGHGRMQVSPISVQVSFNRRNTVMFRRYCQHRIIRERLSIGF